MPGILLAMDSLRYTLISTFPLMKLLFKGLLRTTAIIASVCASFAHAAVETGKPAPNFTFTDPSGKTHQLSDFRGKVVIMEWLNPGCPYILRHYRSGNLPALQAKAAADGAIWLQVNSSAMGDLDPARSAEWQKKQGAIATAYIRDESGKLGRLYGAETTPHFYVISGDGTLVYQGAIDDQPNASLPMTLSAHNYVSAALAALKAGSPVEQSTTKPYGCGVKYGNSPDGENVETRGK